MLASLLIVFREVLEAGLIVGIVLAATQGIRRRAHYIAIGIGTGLVAASGLAIFAGEITNSLSGFGEEIFNSVILIVAVIMLGWHNLWMVKHGHELASEMKALGNAVSRRESSLPAMATVVAVAVLREGSEVVLFLYGIAAAGQATAYSMLAGGVLGVVAGSLVSWPLYKGLVTIPLSKLFNVTDWLIALLAAGMAGRAAAILAGANLIPAWGYEVWDTSWLVANGSMIGRVLQALLGYSDRPLGVQLAAWAFTLATLIIFRQLIRSRPSAA